MEDDKKNGQHRAVALIGRNLLLRKEQTLFIGFVSEQSDVVSFEVFLGGKDYICVHHTFGAQFPSGQNTHMYHKSPFSSITFQKSKRPSLHSLITLQRQTPRCGELS